MLTYQTHANRELLKYRPNSKPLDDLVIFRLDRLGSIVYSSSYTVLVYFDLA